MDILIREEVKIVFTSAGSPKKFTPMLHEAGGQWLMWCRGSKFARKCGGGRSRRHRSRRDSKPEDITDVKKRRPSPWIPQVRRATGPSGRGSRRNRQRRCDVSSHGIRSRRGTTALLPLAGRKSGFEAFKQRCLAFGRRRHDALPQNCRPHAW